MDAWGAIRNVFSIGTGIPVGGSISDGQSVVPDIPLPDISASVTEAVESTTEAIKGLGTWVIIVLFLGAVIFVARAVK